MITKAIEKALFERRIERALIYMGMNPLSKLQSEHTNYNEDDRGNRYYKHHWISLDAIHADRFDIWDADRLEIAIEANERHEKENKA